MNGFRVLRKFAFGLIIMLCACGSDGSNDDATESSALPDGRSADEAAADQAFADDAILTLDDFPIGWESREPDEEDNNEQLEVLLAECLDVDPALFADSAVRSESDTFVRESDEVEAGVTIQPTVKDAEARMAIARVPNARSCYQSAIQGLIEENVANPDPGAELPEGAEVGEATVGEVSLPEAGDDIQGFRITVPITVEDLEVKVVLDLVNVRVGRATATFSFQSVLTSFDSDLQQDLISKVTDRLPTA